jgi:hypothetical protein
VAIAKIAQALRKSEASITQHIGDYDKRLKLKPAGVALPVISILSKPSNWLHICQKSLKCTPIK